MNKIVPLPGAFSASREVGHYVRIGDTGHKILEDLVAEGRFWAQRVVVDASHHKQQAHLIEALSSSQGGLELILDTKCAELAALGKYKGVAKDAPWRLRPKDEKLSMRLENNKKRMSRSALDKLATERESSTLRPRQVPQRATSRRDIGNRKL